MLAIQQKAAAAYRSASFDARVRGAGAKGLVLVCLEQVAEGVGQSLHAHQRDDRTKRAEGLAAAHAALTALDMGIDRNAPLAEALSQLYTAARNEVLDSVTDFSPERLERVKADFLEIATVFRSLSES